jgi:hypothetical protein
MAVILELLINILNNKIKINLYIIHMFLSEMQVFNSILDKKNNCIKIKIFYIFFYIIKFFYKSCEIKEHYQEFIEKL